MITKEITPNVTKKGQVTIPSEVRRHLGLDTPDKVTFVIEDDRVHLKPSRTSLASLFGSIPALDPAESTDFEVEIEEALADESDHIAHELNHT